MDTYNVQPQKSALSVWHLRQYVQENIKKKGAVQTFKNVPSAQPTQANIG